MSGGVDVHVVHALLPGRSPPGAPLPRHQTGTLSQNAPQLRHIVTVVVVTHDGARLLPGLLQAVREQTHPVHQIVGVDTGSRDRSGAVLAELLGPEAVFGMEPDTGYGAAVARALQHAAVRGQGPDPAPGQHPSARWIWLLHDDCEPAADALEHDERFGIWGGMSERERRRLSRQAG